MPGTHSVGARTSQYPAAAACSSTLHRATYAPGPNLSSDAGLFPFPINTRRTTRCRSETCSPFCFTFSKEATRSESEPGNALRCCACCCCIADGGRCASNLTPGGNCGCACACAAGGNGDDPSACCWC